MTDASIRVSYQGEEGSNSDLACREMLPQAQRLGQATFEDSLDAVLSGATELAVIPVENSIAGRVADVHHLLPASGLQIVGEHFLPVHFQLAATPGATLATVRQVRSHPHAFWQCRKILREYGLASVVTGDTAGAAREVAELRDPSVAALAPRLAAELYGLEILAHDVEDFPHNTTRFLLLADRANAAVVPASSGPTITTFVFRVRNIPAALFKALGGFATNGVNMTKLESYQLEGSFSATQFYADVEGHPEQPALSRALAELDYFCEEVRILGTYPANPFRLRVAPTPPGLA